MKTTNFGVRLMEKDIGGLITPLPGQTFYNELNEAIKQTKNKIDIMQYQWNFYPGKKENRVQIINQTLIYKLRQGIKCRILMNREGRGQHLTAINMKASRYLSEAGAIIKMGRINPITHAKLWIIDDDISILGSHNLSNRAFTVNNEVSVIIKSRPVANEYRRYFEAIWQTI